MGLPEPGDWEIEPRATYQETILAPMAAETAFPGSWTQAESDSLGSFAGLMLGVALGATAWGLLFLGWQLIGLLG